MNEALLVIILGTATPGGGFPVYGAAFAETINAQEPGLRVETRHTKGSAENVPLLEAGKLDIALVAGDYASGALARAGNGLRIITAMYGSPGMFVVRGDSPAKSIADLRGKPVVLGTQGSGLTVLGRMVLKSLGVEVQEMTLEKAADGPALVYEGKAVALWGAGVGWPGFAAMAKQGGRFIVPNAGEIRTILAVHPELKAMTMPAGSYAGQATPLQTVGSWSFVLCSEQFPEEKAYLLARALHRGEGALAARLAQAKETTVANTVAAAPRADLIHAGVRKYFREIGLMP